jgi:hypothetical protein
MVMLIREAAAALNSDRKAGVYAPAVAQFRIFSGIAFWTLQPLAVINLLLMEAWK